MKYKYLFQSASDPSIVRGSNSDVQAMTLDDDEWITINCEDGTVDTIVVPAADDEELGIKDERDEPEEEAEDDDD